MLSIKPKIMAPAEANLEIIIKIRHFLRSKSADPLGERHNDDPSGDP